jgi:hypothetical protein
MPEPKLKPETALRPKEEKKEKVESALKVVPKPKEDSLVKLAKYLQKMFNVKEIERGDLITYKDENNNEIQCKVMGMDERGIVYATTIANKESKEGRMVKIKKEAIESLVPKDFSFYHDKIEDVMYLPGDIVKFKTRDQEFVGEIQSFFYDKDTKTIKAMALTGYNKQGKEMIEFPLAKDIIGEAD